MRGRGGCGCGSRRGCLEWDPSLFAEDGDAGRFPLVPSPGDCCTVEEGTGEGGARVGEDEEEDEDDDEGEEEDEEAVLLMSLRGGRWLTLALTSSSSSPVALVRSPPLSTLSSAPLPAPPHLAPPSELPSRCWLAWWSSISFWYLPLSAAASSSYGFRSSSDIPLQAQPNLVLMLPKLSSGCRCFNPSLYAL